MTTPRLASRAFYAARPVMSLDLACFTLDRSVIATLKAYHAARRGVPVELRVQLSREIGAFLHGERKQIASQHWLNLAMATGSVVKCPSDLMLEAMARAVQHQGFNALLAGSPEGLKLLDIAGQRLLDANYATGPVNNFQHKLGFLLRDGKSKRAMQEIEFLQASAPEVYRELCDLRVDALARRLGKWLACGLAGIVADAWTKDGRSEQGKALAMACWRSLATTDTLFQGPIESIAVAKIAHAEGRTVFASGLADSDWQIVNARLEQVRELLFSDPG